MSKNLIVVGVFVSAVLAGCASSGKTIEENANLEPEVKVEVTNKYPVEWVKDTVTKREMDKVTSLVVGSARYPAGTRFGNIWALNSSQGKRILCGYVNLRDADGTYQGERMFGLLGLLDEDLVAFQHGAEGDLFPRVCEPRVMQPEPVYIN